MMPIPPLRTARSIVSSVIAAYLLFPVCFSQTEMPSPARLAGQAQTYQVVKGDTLYGIARRFGLAYPAISQANGIPNPNMLRLGKTLSLPTQYILPAFREDGIVVNLPEFRLYYFRGGNLQAVYPVAIGLSTWQTPAGPFSVINRVENPAWYMPAELARREHVKREIIKAGPDNPLGDFWIGTSISHTGIHGTNVPMTIGRPLSHGCMRMYPEDIKILFDAIHNGDSGEVLYEPVKAAINGEDILVEAHPDVYGKIPNMLQYAENKLRVLGAWDRVDKKRLSEIVGETRGMPVSVVKK